MYYDSVEYVPHANGVVIYVQTNSQVLKPPFLRQFARRGLCI